MPGGGGELLDFWNGGADVLTWGRLDYMGFEISRHQKCYMCSGIWGRPDYLGSDISGMSWSKPFSYYQVFFRTEQLIIS